MGKEKMVDGRKLVVLSGRAKGTAFILTKPQVNAGRESDNVICLKGKRVSRYHAVLVRHNGEYTLRDVSPHIGTLLNGRRTKEAHLKLGDRIRIGEFEMSYEAATAPAIDVPSTTTSAPLDELTAPCVPVAAAPKEPVAELMVENSTGEYQRRIAELTQERERLVGEVNQANEAVESLRAQLQARSDPQPDLAERLGTMSQENAELAKVNSELQAKISEEVKLANEAVESLRAQLQAHSDLQADLTERLGTKSQENAVLAELNIELQAKITELKASAGKVERVEAELVRAQIALRQMSEDLAMARQGAEELERIQTAPAEARGERNKVSDLPADIELGATENDEMRTAEAKRREVAVLAIRGVSDQTNEQFDRIRRTIVEKKNQQSNKTLLDRFLLPFRDTPRP